MSTMQFELVTPAKLLASRKVDHVAVSGEEGDFGVLPGHAPFISTLKPGAVSVDNGDRTTVYCVGFGFADVNPEGVTILAEEAIAKSDIKVTEVRSKLESVEAKIRKHAHETEQTVSVERWKKEKAVLEAQLTVAAL